MLAWYVVNFPGRIEHPRIDHLQFIQMNLSIYGGLYAMLSIKAVCLLSSSLSSSIQSHSLPLLTILDYFFLVLGNVKNIIAKAKLIITIINGKYII